MGFLPECSPGVDLGGFQAWFRAEWRRNSYTRHESSEMQASAGFPAISHEFQLGSIAHDNARSKIAREYRKARPGAGFREKIFFHEAK